MQSDTTSHNQAVDVVDIETVPVHHSTYAFRNTLAQLNPDFQLANGYPKVAKGKGMKTTSTGYLAAFHGAVSMTLEMPFKDAANAPDERFGWSPERSMALGRSSIEAILSILDEIKN